MLANFFRATDRFSCMETPPLTSTEGAYWYLIGLIVLLALVSTLYIVGAILGVLPEPTRLVSLSPAIPS